MPRSPPLSRSTGPRRTSGECRLRGETLRQDPRSAKQEEDGRQRRAERREG